MMVSTDQGRILAAESADGDHGRVVLPLSSTNAEVGPDKASASAYGEIHISDYDNLLSRLHELLDRLDSSSEDVTRSLAGLAQALDIAVSGSQGFQLTLVHSGLPVTFDLTTGAVGAVQTSMTVPLPSLSAAHEVGGRIVFYSSVPGAFVDLAADLAYALHLSGEEPVPLDVDLLTEPADAVLAGLDDLTAVHRAAGWLIGQGHHPDTVHQTLTELATAHGLSTLAYARKLIGR